MVTVEKAKELFIQRHKAKTEAELLELALSLAVDAMAEKRLEAALDERLAGLMRAEGVNLLPHDVKTPSVDAVRPAFDIEYGALNHAELLELSFQMFCARVVRQRKKEAAQDELAGEVIGLPYRLAIMQAEASKAKQKQTENLARGREQGAQANKEKADDKRARIAEAVRKLYERPQDPIDMHGTLVTMLDNDQLAKVVRAKFGEAVTSGYSESTFKKHVGAEAARQKRLLKGRLKTVRPDLSD